MMNYYLNRDSLHQVYIKSSQDIDMVIIVLSFALNNVHDTNHNSRYWGIVLGPWVRYLVENFYHHDQINDGCILPQSERAEFDIAVNFEGFRHQVEDDPLKFRQSFVSLILYLEKNDIASVSLKNKQKQHHDVNWSYKKIVLLILFRLTRIVPENRLFSTTIYTPSLFFNSIFRLRLVPSPAIHRKTYIAPSIDFDMREKLYKIGQTQLERCKVDDKLWKIVCATIPLSYLEGYLRLIDNSKQYGRHVKMMLCNDIHSSDSYKAWVASSIEKGTKLIVAQHGGGFGIVFHDYSEDHQIKVADLFLSWSHMDRLNTMQVPSQKFLQKKGDSNDLSIVLVNVTYVSFHKYHSGPETNNS